MKTVSIIIPVYNRANLVMRTLQTVVDQTYRPLQIVLVDNFSTDDTLVVLNQFKIDNNAPDFEVIVTQEKLHTASAARNRGMQFANGEYLMFFDSDDLMERRLVQKYVDAFESSPQKVDIVMTRRNLVNDIGEKTAMPIFKKDLIANHILHSVMATQAFCARRDFIKDKEWNNNILQWDDFEYGLRLLLTKPVVGYLDGKPRVDVIFGGENSITGTNFSSNHGKWEVALRTMVLDIKNSSLLNKQRYYDLLYYRLLVLAAHYHREGHPEYAKPTAQKAYSVLNRKWIYRKVMPRLFKRIVRGKRGSARIARWIIK
ncbi:MAG: glycosyltransferase family 2 protein [Muribaculaceae bacterium]|nr:glycosyltransferase family 2 protein [Muribaculaceae bacterium]